jgi:plasmid stabilization system protein ParE
MAQVIYSAGALVDLERIFQALERDDPTLAANSSGLICSSIRELGARPTLGRPAEAGLRERAISRAKTGYVVLYRFLELDDVVLIAAIRHRHEAGYPDPG